MKKEYNVTNIKNMRILAEELAAKSIKGDTYALNGPLGAGKTTFSQFFINYFFETKQIITSPTFSLVQQYDAKQAPIWHFDLYRIKSEQELYEIGIEDALNNGISLIEWAKKAENIIPKFKYVLDFEYDEKKRIITLEENNN